MNQNLRVIRTNIENGQVVRIDRLRQLLPQSNLIKSIRPLSKSSRSGFMFFLELKSSWTTFKTDLKQMHQISFSKSFFSRKPKADKAYSYYVFNKKNKVEVTLLNGEKYYAQLDIKENSFDKKIAYLRAKKDNQVLDIRHVFNKTFGNLDDKNLYVADLDRGVYKTGHFVEGKKIAHYNIASGIGGQFHYGHTNDGKIVYQENEQPLKFQTSERGDILLCLPLEKNYSPSNIDDIISKGRVIVLKPR